LELALNAVFAVYLVVIIGGVDMMTQSLQLAKKPHIVIGIYSQWNTAALHDSA